MKKIFIFFAAVAVGLSLSAQTYTTLGIGISNPVGTLHVHSSTIYDPQVPSAASVDEEGVDVGEMNKVLLQKVEELTLYIIDLQKQIDELKKTKQ